MTSCTLRTHLALILVSVTLLAACFDLWETPDDHFDVIGQLRLSSLPEVGCEFSAEDNVIDLEYPSVTFEAESGRMSIGCDELIFTLNPVPWEELRALPYGERRLLRGGTRGVSVSEEYDAYDGWCYPHPLIDEQLRIYVTRRRTPRDGSFNGPYEATFELEGPCIEGTFDFVPTD